MRTLRLLRLLAVLTAFVAAAAGTVIFRLTRRVRGDWFDSAGVRLHYTDEGAGEPVVLLHGFAVNADLNWRLPGITQALANEFRVIAMDLRGHGLSDKPRGAGRYGLEMVEDVPRLLDHLGIEKAHVVGYSLGAIVTLKLAATHPARLLTASPLGAGWERAEDSPFLDAIADIAADLESGRGIGPLSGYLGDEREKPGLLHTWWVKLMTRYLADGPGLANVVRSLPELTLDEAEVRGISVPVCSIAGSRDPLRVGVEALRGVVPDLEVVIVEGADHLGAPRRPELLRALSSFLRRHGEQPSRRGEGAATWRS